ncbi:MAG TPA: flagellar biosynthesis anti-sigma factor FlgM [Polyangiaceae bacterium]|jgi:flagellar biosynthesis anti-sigma factor FlgM
MKGITGNPALDAYHRMAVSPVGSARPVEKAAPTAGIATGDAAAEVKISARARDLAAEAKESAVDTQKVEALKQQIAEGSFRIDSQAIASRMIEQLA